MDFSQIYGHRYFTAYAFYFFTSIFYAAIMVSLGPLIPYLAHEDGNSETEYSYLFIFRACGTVTGSLLCKITSNYFTYHQMMGVSTFIMGISSLLFNFSQSEAPRVITMFFATLGCAKFTVFMHLSMLKAFRGNNLDSWLQVNHISFGIGGLISPLIVYLFELNTFAFIGIVMLLHFFVYFFLASPEVTNRQGQIQGENENQYGNVQNEAEQDLIQIQWKTSLAICLVFYFIVGQQSVFGGWISSYSVIEGYNTKQEATIYATVYWISITAFRLIFSFIAGKVSVKVVFLSVVAVLTAAVGLVLIHSVDPHFGMFFSAVFFGLSNSVLYALCYILPQQYGIPLNPSQGSNFAFAAAVGDGTLVTISGVLMTKFGNDMLFITMGIWNGLLLLLLLFSIWKLRIQSEEIDKTNEVAEVDFKK